jgi:hypothetical protein
MALLSRGLLPSEPNFNLAYERAVGDVNLPFEISSGMLDGLLDDLALADALEMAGIDRECALGEDKDLELDRQQLADVLVALNDMFLDGDEGAGQACETILGQLGFTWV